MGGALVKSVSQREALLTEIMNKFQENDFTDEELRKQLRNIYKILNAKVSEDSRKLFIQAFENSKGSFEMLKLIKISKDVMVVRDALKILVVVSPYELSIVNMRESEVLEIFKKAIDQFPHDEFVMWGTEESTKIMCESASKYATERISELYSTTKSLVDIVDILKMYKRNEIVQTEGFIAIYKISIESPEVMKAVIDTENGVKPLLESVEHHICNETLLIHGLTALTGLAKQKDIASLMGRSGIMKIVADILKQYGKVEKDILQQILWLLSELAKSEKNQYPMEQNKIALLCKYSIKASSEVQNRRRSKKNREPAKAPLTVPLVIRKLVADYEEPTTITEDGEEVPVVEDLGMNVHPTEQDLKAMDSITEIQDHILERRKETARQAGRVARNGQRNYNDLFEGKRKRNGNIFHHG